MELEARPGTSGSSGWVISGPSRSVGGAGNVNAPLSKREVSGSPSCGSTARSRGMSAPPRSSPACESVVASEFSGASECLRAS